MLPLNSPATSYRGWHKLTTYRPAKTGLYLITVHPGGCEYWCYWTGFAWGVFASTQEQACLPYMYGTASNLPDTIWFKGEALLRVNKVKEVRMFNSFKAPSSRKFVSTYSTFFGVSASEPETSEEEEEEEEAAQTADVSAWEQRDKTSWFDASVAPARAGVYEAVDAFGFKGPVTFNGRRWETSVSKWRGLNAKAHAKFAKRRELDSHDF